LFRVVNVITRTLLISHFLLAGFLVASLNAQTSSGSSVNSPAQTSSAKSTASAGDRVVMKVGDVQITQAQFESMVSELEAQQGPADLSRQAIGENYADLLMLSQQAVENHLDTSPEVLHQLAIDRTQILSNAEFARLKSAAKPTPEEISAYYNDHLDEYDTITVRRLFIWKKQPGVNDHPGLEPKEAEALATAIREAYATGADPKKLIHDTNIVVLDDPPLTFQRGEMPPGMDKAAFALTKEGEWKVFEDNDSSLVMLQLVKRDRIALKVVSPQIAKKLQAAKLRAELENLKKKTGVWLDDQYFAASAKSPDSSTHPETTGPKVSADNR
jgi:hypothetical protein